MGRESRARRRDDVVEVLVRSGLPRHVAKALAFLSTRGETTSVEIEKATGLRQPEVSLAMQALRRRKWVEKRDVKKAGKGRPVHAYSLAVPFSEIADALARAQRKRIEDIRSTMRQLKKYAG